MMDLPGLPLLEELTAPRAAPLLLLPQVVQPSSARERLLHLPEQASLEVSFPLGVVGVGVAPDLHVPPDRYPRRLQQANRVRLPLAVSPGPCEHPVALPDALEVFLLEPRPGLPAVAPPAPPPEHAED